MPCAACRSRGVVAYGRWHEDPECPSRNAKKDLKPSVPPKAQATATFVVTNTGDESSDSEAAYMIQTVVQDDAHGCPVNAIVMTTSGTLREMTHGLAVADTACARTVVGFKWVDIHVATMVDRGIPFVITEDDQPFRFGDGPRVTASYAIVFPLYIGKDQKVILLRASVVDEDVPLLVSSKALRSRGLGR